MTNDLLRLSDFTDYHQMIRDNYEQVIRNDRRGRNMEIEIDEKYQTPAEYKKMIDNMEKWSSMPDMRDLVAYSRTLAKKANALLQGKIKLLSITACNLLVAC